MKNIKKLAALVAVLSALFLSGCNIREEKMQKEEKYKTQRFREVGTVSLRYSTYYKEAIIYMDTTTGFQYLYAFINGRPILTKL